MLANLWIAFVAVSALGFLVGVATGARIGGAAPADGRPEVPTALAARAVWTGLPLVVAALITAWSLARL